MLIYWNKTGLQQPLFLDYKCMTWDVKGAGRMFHFDLPGMAAPAVPTDESLLKKIDEGLYIFESGPAPTPQQLLKRQVPLGSKVKLADGNEWVVPMVRNAMDGTLLPERVKMNFGGQMVRVKPEYAQAYEAGLKIWKWLEDVEKPESFEEVYDTYATILKVNYHITKYDAWHYGLYCTETRLDFYFQCVDFHTYSQYLKGGLDEKK